MAKPPPPGYERHPLDPNLVRRVLPPTVAGSLWPDLPSAQGAAPSHSAQESDAARGFCSQLGGKAR
jgi:hypothetical protein